MHTAFLERNIIYMVEEQTTRQSLASQYKHRVIICAWSCRGEFITTFGERITGPHPEVTPRARQKIENVSDISF